MFVLGGVGFKRTGKPMNKKAIENPAQLMDLSSCTELRNLRIMTLNPTHVFFVGRVDLPFYESNLPKKKIYIYTYIYIYMGHLRSRHII